MQVSKVRLRSLQRKEIQSKQRDHQRPDKRLSCIKSADQLLMLYQTGLSVGPIPFTCRRPKYRPIAERGHLRRGGTNKEREQNEVMKNEDLAVTLSSWLGSAAVARSHFASVPCRKRIQTDHQRTSRCWGRVNLTPIDPAIQFLKRLAQQDCGLLGSDLRTRCRARLAPVELEQIATNNYLFSLQRYLSPTLHDVTPLTR